MRTYTPETWETDFGTPIFDEDKKNFTQRNQGEVEVGQTGNGNHSSHTSGTNPRKRLENSDSVPEISGRNQDNARTTENDVLESSGSNEDTPRSDDKGVLECSGQNEESSFSTNKGVLECSGPNEESSQSNENGVLEKSGHSEDYFLEPHSDETQLSESSLINPRSEKYNLRQNPKPNCNDDYRY